MSDTMEIIIKAVDSASDVFRSIINDATDMGDSISDSLSEATSEVERLEDALDQAHFDGDDIEADIIADELAEARSKAEQLQESLTQMGTSNGLDELGNDIQQDKSKFTQLKETITSTFESTKGIVTGFGSTLSDLGGKVTSVGSKFRDLRSSINYAGVGAINTGASFGFLRDVASMTVGMIGYDLVNGFMESGRAAINARSQFEYFAGRLGMSSNQVKDFQQDVSNMQKEFRKVDMTAVAATAEEIAVKNGMAASSVGELTRMTAVLSSTFVKEGRTQEDAILAVSDALDGQFKRLQEIGITQDELINNGWSGDLSDQEGLIQALNKTMQDMGYEQTAKDITNLDEAFNALSISGGQLLADILVPIAPTLIGIMEGAMVTADGISDFIGMIQSAFAGLPDWAQITFGVTALGIAFGIVGTIIMSTYIPGMVASVISTINWIATALGAEVSAITLSGAFGLLATSIWAALAPLLPFIVAGALVVAAIYEIGKAFGWWTDVGSMLSAIHAGVNRLWSAFINHPDVQAVITALTNAWNELMKILGGVKDAILDFFGITTGGDFDIVHALIVGLGEAWNAICEPIIAVIDIIMTVIDVFSQLANGQMDLETAVLTVWNSLAANIPIVLQFIYNYLFSFVGQLAIYAVQGGLNFLNGIVTYLSQVPGRVWNYLVMTYTRTVTQLTLWVNRARAMALQFVIGIITRIATLPARIRNYLIQVVSVIIAAIQSWITHAVAKVHSFVSQVTSPFKDIPGKISSALSGVVSAITKPFTDAYDSVSKTVDDIKNKVSDALSEAAKLTGFGGDTAYGGDTAVDVNGRLFDTGSGEWITSDENINVEITEKIILDLINVPAHIDTATLIKMLQNKEVLRALTGNKDFQDLDAKVKNAILEKIRRSKGV